MIERGRERKDSRSDGDEARVSESRKELPEFGDPNEDEGGGLRGPEQLVVCERENGTPYTSIFSSQVLGWISGP